MERGKSIKVEKAIQVMVVHKVCVLGGTLGPRIIIVPLLSVSAAGRGRLL